ncbi:hypothetical protein CNEO2_340048 [Clostridium neonatale]|nr:hypothetical protein CNEO2_340048 [Clostridium neonatale]
MLILFMVLSMDAAVSESLLFKTEMLCLTLFNSKYKLARLLLNSIENLVIDSKMSALYAKIITTFLIERYILLCTF